MSLFNELKRRNIFKVAVAYLALGWVVVQITDIVVPALNLPDMLNAVVVYIGIVGFPFALFFAWAFEMTPDGVRKTADVDEDASITHSTGQNLNYAIIGLLSIAVVFLLFNQGEEPTAENELTKSIAVLPFVNMSGDENNVYFSDGLSEELLNVLVKIPDLKVAGRTSSFAYRGQNLDLRTIGQTLGVNHLLEGSVRKQGNQVRITAQLVRADDGFHIWSETYDRELSDIFIVQEQIANAIVTNMALSMDISDTSTLITSRTENMEAYELYLEAKALVTQRTMPNVIRAIMLLNQATELDQNYAAAWAMLAQAHALTPYYPGIESTLMAMHLGEEAARRALILDENSSFAHAALGDIEKDKFHWAEAEEHYLRALNLNPQNAEANEQLGQLYYRLGYLSKAAPYASKARQLEPASNIYTIVDKMVKYFLHRRKEKLDEFIDAEIQSEYDYSNAASRFSAGLKIDSVIDSQKYLTMSFGTNNVRDTEFYNEQLIASLNDPKSLNDYLRNTYNILQTRPQDLNADNRFAGVVFALLATKNGDYDLALDFIEMEQGLTIENRNNDNLLWLWASVHDSIQNHPRLKQIRRNYGLVDHWKKNGWPDFCQPVGDDDFECGWVQTEQGGK